MVNRARQKRPQGTSREHEEQSREEGAERQTDRRYNLLCPRPRSLLLSATREPQGQPGTPSGPSEGSPSGWRSGVLKEGPGPALPARGVWGLTPRPTGGGAFQVMWSGADPR